MTNRDATDLLRAAFSSGLHAVMPAGFMADVTAEIMSDNSGKKRHILSIGKAAGAMAQGYFAHGGTALSTLVILPDNVDMDAGSLPDNCQIIASAHPVPNDASETAAKAALSLSNTLGADDLLIVLLSGGGSSLMSLGGGAVSLADKQALNEILLASGISIQEMNVIRKHVSAIKGGRLALAASPAKVMCFALSDVPGDAPDAIASGPVSGDDSTFTQAIDIIKKNKLSLPSAIMTLLQDPASESPFPDDERLAQNDYQIIASAKHALEASAKIVRKAGYQPVILGDRFQEDTKMLADIMVEKLATLPMGTALISGGEASVKIEGRTDDLGIGGRNAQFALEMARRNLSDICGISCDTDGIDGAGKHAGALFYHGLIEDAGAQGIDIDTYYRRYDSHSFFEAMGCHIHTGPTQTNVNDLRILLKGLPQAAIKA